MQTGLPAEPSGRFVFLDPTGRRWSVLRKSVVFLLVVALVALAGFVEALLVRPQLRLPPSIRKLKGSLRATEAQDLPCPGSAAEWQMVAARVAPLPPRLDPRHAPAPLRSFPEVRLGYYVDWDPNSRVSLERHADLLTHVCPEWLALTDGEGNLTAAPDVPFETVTMGGRLTLMPLLHNLDGDRWIPEAVENLATGPPERRARFLTDLVASLTEVGAGGVVLDWERMDPTVRDDLTGLLREMAAALHAADMELWLTVPMGGELAAFDIGSLAPAVDRFIAALHDESSDTDGSGPIASQPWIDGWVGAVSRFGNPEQWIADLGAYGYDWKQGARRADTLSFADAMARADNAGVGRIEVSAPDYNARYGYHATDGDHAVSFLDAVSFANHVRSAHAAGFGGLAISRLGLEDPAVWDVLRFAPTGSVTPQGVEILAPLRVSDMIASVGGGEVVTVDDTTAPGRRAPSVDASGRVAAAYVDFPKLPTLFHEGGTAPRDVVLTFDDGPDADWTPRILDILKAYGVRATFFVVGRQAQEYPELIERIVREGHEIGSHTYTHANLAAITHQQVRIELNATQRLVENLTGRSITLFRPPYSADAHPADMAELGPLALIQNELGYLVVLENIDPQDWSEPGAGVILERVKAQRAQGNIILLHDAGGNRVQTVEALPRIIDWLHERGDRIVTVGALLGLRRDEIMPPLPKDEGRVPRTVAGVGFLIWGVLEEAAWGFMLLATVLVVLRALIVAALAVRHRTPAGVAAIDPPPLSILVAAYNEERVIAATLRSLLDTDYPAPVEVIVVNDGSTDGTARLVGATARADARIRLINRPNGGKAMALQAAVGAARHEIVVCIDADTVFEPATLARLVAPFADPTVGAVSGHARVGNLRSYIARCQELEYLCGFNLDRRAFAAWNCITVVPGAVSALRKRAIVEAGGFSTDTLAEDTDLTLAVHRRGWRVAYAADAIAHTEAPETISGFVKQRFRWAFGTMQCLWKHRDLLFDPRFGALGLFSLPGIWFFQVVLVALAPVIDLFLVLSLSTGWIGALWYYAVAFLLTDLLLAALACRLDGERLGKSLRIIPMRVLYRPVLSWVVWKSLLRAAEGVWVSWGKLDRTASVPSRA